MSNSGLFITAIEFNGFGEDEKRTRKFVLEFNNVLQIHGRILYSGKNNNWFIILPQDSYKSKEGKNIYQKLVVIDNEQSRKSVESKILEQFNNDNPNNFFSGDSTYMVRKQAKKDSYKKYQEGPQNNPPQQQQAPPAQPTPQQGWGI